MGLLANNFRDRSGVFKTYGATVSNNAFPSSDEANFHRTGANRNITAGEGVTSQLSGVPYGYRNGGAWTMPQKAGALGSVNEAQITFASTANGAQGINLESESTIIFTSSATGQAVASGTGSASIVISGSATAVAPLNAVGTSTIVFTGSGALSAPSDISASSSIVITTDAELRADGFMVATPISTDLTVDQIVAGVWNALASSYNATGSMGEKLNDAGAAGNPWAALTADNLDPDTFGKLVQDTLRQAKLAASLSA